MCPTEDELAALVAGKLTPAEVCKVHEHAETCTSCRQLLVQIAMAGSREGGEGAETADPVHDPGEEMTAPEQTPPGPIAAGSRLGRYHILQLQGMGGMGTVYAAYDPVLDRRVALKVLRAPSVKAQQRFELRLQREAQAMAKLAHPNVVAVHDVGGANDQVFVAMEYVDGSTLRQWLKAGTPTWTQIRDVFVQAGRGLSAAHAAGLVHRDFKPDNVLIGLDGRVRVADFGLARALESRPPSPSPESNSDPLVRVGTELTEAGMLMGTPRYMAPEQLRGEAADARADQFSFAVALYEALYGQRPFTPEEPFARLEAIERGEVCEPRASNGAPEWMWAAIRPALSADPVRRYPSLEPLLQSLVRDRRGRAPAGRTAAALAVGITALAGAAVWALRPDPRCQNAPELLEGTWDGARRTAVLQGLGAQSEHAKRTVAALDGYARDWIAMHQDACAAARIRGDQTLATMDLRMACLERRRKDLGYLAALLVEPNPKLGARAVDAAFGLPSVRDCGDTSALAEHVPLPADPAARAAINTLAERLSEVNALRLAGRYAESLRRLEPLERESARLGYRPLQAEALYQKGLVLDRSGKPSDARGPLVEASYAAEAGGDDAQMVAIASRLVLVNGQLGVLEGQSEKFDQGEHWARVGQAALERGGGNPGVEGALLNDLGSLQLMEGNFDQALNTYERSVRLLTAALGPEHAQTLNAISNLAQAHYRADHLEEAVRLLDQLIPAIERLRGSSHPVLYSVLETQGWALQRLHRFPAAHSAAARALAIAQGSEQDQPDRSHQWAGRALDLEATILQEEKRFRDALEKYREALAVKRATSLTTDSELSHSYDGIGQCLLELGQAAEAVEPLETALKKRGPDPEPKAETEFALARAFWLSRGGRTRAEELARQAQADFEKAHLLDKQEEVAKWLRLLAARGP